jgi:hypothetical protein
MTGDAQLLAGFAQNHDFVALTADPGVLPADPLLRRKLVMMLRRGQPLAARMRALQNGGVLNFGYGPDDFMHDDPPLAEVAPAMSLRVNPLAAGGAKK